jgi:hypothetical protein
VKRCRTFATDADLAAYDLRRGVRPAMDAFA